MALLAYILLLCLWVTKVWSRAIFIEIPAGGEECYYEAYEKEEVMEFLVQIKRGGQHDIQIKVFSPYDSLLEEKVATKYHRYQLNIEFEGTYKICFNNGMSRFTPKLVGIDLLGSHRPQTVHYNQLMKKRHLNYMERTVLNIGRRLDAIGQLQELAVELEETYEDSVIASNNLSAYVSMVELSLVLIVYMYQIKTIRSWFKRPGHKFSV